MGTAGIINGTNTTGAGTNATIKNCSVDEFKVNGNTISSLGGVIAWANNYYNIVISDCNVNNMNIDGSGSIYAGGIICISNANTTIKNCKVENIKSEVEVTEFGGFSRFVNGEINIENCKVNNMNAKVKSGTSCGGMIAVLCNEGTISKCNVDGLNVTSSGLGNTGGILGTVGTNKIEIKDCNVSNSTFEGPSAGTYFNYGGIAGFIKDGSIKNCNIANVEMNITTTGTSPNKFGGVLGATDVATIDKCSVKDTKINDTGCVVMGGICGFGVSVSNSIVENTELTTTGTAEAVAGIIGKGQKNATIESLVENCSVNNCEITANNAIYVGGIAGASIATISECTVDESTIKGATDSIGGIQGFGGIIGEHNKSAGSKTSVVIEDSNVTNCNILSNATNKGYIQGCNSYDENNVSNDRITNCTHEGTTLGTL